VKLEIPAEILSQIHRHGESAYPEEGAGLLLGNEYGMSRVVCAILELPNTREGEARRTRYLLSAEDYLRGEVEADRQGLSVLGVFHSHPDHPNRPSEFDRDWAWPNYSYIITSVYSGRAIESRVWRLTDDRQEFVEESIAVMDLENHPQRDISLKINP
jgi:proteasome lid subunit RPN8/RPN11